MLMTAERGDSKSIGALATVVLCLIYGLNPAEKLRLVPRLYRQSEHAKLSRVWGPNGVKTGGHFATRASQAAESIVAEADESAHSSRVGSQVKRTACCLGDPIFCRHADINLLPVNRRD